MITLQNLTKRYQDAVIFENASFSFPDKGLFCILGPSGCGKSTLLNLIAGFDSSYSGSISVNGQLLEQLSEQELCSYRREQIGFVFQNYHLLAGFSAMENLLLARELSDPNGAKGAVKAAELLGRLGLSDKADQKVETLSGGQKQRVAIARALINEPSVILADEPTGALDRKNSAEIMELLQKLSETRLVIVITHDKKCAEYAEQIITIENGVLCGKSAESSPDSDARGSKAGSIPKLRLWRRAMRNNKVRLARYLAVAAAVSFGMIAFALSLSSQNILQSAIAEFEQKNTAYHSGYLKTDNDAEAMLALLAGDDRLEHIYAQYPLHELSVSFGGKTELLADKYPLPKATQQMSYGVMPRRGQNEIAVSPSLAAKFSKNISELIGKTVTLTCGEQTFSLTVSGIFNAVYDDFFISPDLEQTLYRNPDEKVYSVSYDVIRFEDITAVSQELKAQGCRIQDASAEVAAFLNTFRNLNRLFLTVSLLILSVSVLISCILLVKQQHTRFREVGLLAALGYPKSSVRKLLLYENLGLSALTAVCSAVFLLLALIIGTVCGIAWTLSPLQLTAIPVLTAVLIVLLGTAASLSLMRAEPAEALRR